jgi:peptidoglycan hydrolase CwlO-like protein
MEKYVLKSKSMMIAGVVKDIGEHVTEDECSKFDEYVKNGVLVKESVFNEIKKGGSPTVNMSDCANCIELQKANAEIEKLKAKKGGSATVQKLKAVISEMENQAKEKDDQIEELEKEIKALSEPVEDSEKDGEDSEKEDDSKDDSKDGDKK